MIKWPKSAESQNELNQKSHSAHSINLNADDKTLFYLIFI